MNSIRQAIAELPGSRIREVANAAMGRPDVLAFWFGESDEVTPESVRQAAADSLADGETFYSHNLGLPSLRHGLARYVSALHGPIGEERIAVTSSGVSALMLAMQMLVGPGDEVVAVTPVWPNLTAQPLILGAQVRRLALSVDAVSGRWSLDMQRLLDTVTSNTRVLRSRSHSTTPINETSATSGANTPSAGRALNNNHKASALITPSGPSTV